MALFRPLEAVTLFLGARWQSQNTKQALGLSVGGLFLARISMRKVKPPRLKWI
jgi:hypothetical protein